MKMFTKLFAVSAITFASMGANAELVPGDWMVEGDSKTILDTLTGKEWLTFTETSSMSIADIQNNSYFDGWRFADFYEVIKLLKDISNDNAVNESRGDNYSGEFDYYEAMSAQTLFGNVTYQNGGWNEQWTSAAIIKDHGMGYIQRIQFSSSKSGNYQAGYNVVDSYQSDTWSNQDIGFYMVSDGGLTLSSKASPDINTGVGSVPLPATAALLGLGLLGFGARRKKNG